MSFIPKRPSSSSTPPAVRPASARPSSSVRPSTIRDAQAEAHAVGGGAIARPSAFAAAGKKTILLVDPDASLRARLRALLEPDYQVVEAKDGLEALELSSKMTPSMIVSDTAMPNLDGFSLAKITRNNPLLKRLPIMFVSSQHSPQHVTQALVIGVSQYLPKTTPVAQIAETIRKIAH